MPERTEDGQWRWGNIKRKTKGELVKVVYGIWISQGKPGTWHDFWHSGNPYGKKSKKSKKKNKGTVKKESFSYSFVFPYALSLQDSFRTFSFL